MRNRVKRHRPCACRPETTLDSTAWRKQACAWGNCVQWRCYFCDGYLGGYGEIWCRCDGGCYRAFRHPGMESANYAWTEESGRVYRHAAVKPSIARRSQAGRHNRGRRG